MPVRRSARMRAAASSIATGWARKSTMTKSLPNPCILRNAILPMARLYGGAAESVQRRLPAVAVDEVSWQLGSVVSAIRLCRADERAAILAIVNAAAEAYRGVIPA